MPSIEDFFPEKTESRPMIYAYSDESYPGCLKIGYTTIGVEKRVAQQYPTKRPDGSVPYKIMFSESAMLSDGSVFDDHAVHRVLKKRGCVCRWRMV